MSPIREQMIGVTLSIVLVFLLTGGAALYCVLYASAELAVMAINLQLIFVLYIALAGYEHGRAMVNVHDDAPDAITYTLTAALAVGVIISATAGLVALRNVGFQI